MKGRGGFWKENYDSIMVTKWRREEGKREKRKNGREIDGEGRQAKDTS